MIYSYFNQDKYRENNWESWDTLWRLKVAPRVKYFLWLLFHNAVKTHEYHYKMNLGPQAFCTFCNLNVETAEHLFLNCHLSQEIWKLTCSAVRKPINLFDGVSSGLWLNQELTGNDNYTQYVIASTVWFIWKARCNKIFNNEQLDCHNISSRATRHVREYFFSSSLQLGKNFILNNFSIAGGPIMFTTAVYNEELFIAKLGFIVADSYSNLICAGCCGCPADSVVDAEAKVLCFSLQGRINWRMNIKTILSPCSVFLKAVQQGIFWMPGD